MADISKIKLPSGTSYDVKDTTARNDTAMNLSSIRYINAFTGISKRNLWNPTIPSTAGGLTTIIDDDKTFYLSGAASKFTAYLSPQNNSSYFPTGKALIIRGAERLDGCTYMCVKKTSEGTTQYVQIGKNDITIPADEQLIHIYIQVLNDASIDVKISPMVCFADNYDGIYEPYIKNDLQTQINLIHNYVYISQYLHKNLSLDEGYIVRIGNQLHLNFTATCTSTINSWEAILGLPFYIKSPTKARYYIYNTQEDETKITLYIDDNKNEIFTQSNIAVGNKVYIKGLILDIKGEQNFPTDTGWVDIPNPDSTIYSSAWNTKYRKIGDDIDIYVDIKTIASISCDSSGISVLCTLPSEIIPSRIVRQTGYMNISSSDPRIQVTLGVNSDSLKIYVNEKTNYTIPAGTYIYGELRYFI